MDLFYIPLQSLHIRRCRGLLANDNPASTSPGRRIVGVFILGTRVIHTAWIGIGGRENAPQVRKMVCVYTVELTYANEKMDSKLRERKGMKIVDGLI